MRQVMMLAAATATLCGCGGPKPAPVKKAEAPADPRLILKCDEKGESVMNSVAGGEPTLAVDRSLFYRIDEAKKTVELWNGSSFDTLCTGNQPCKVEISRTNISVTNLNITDENGQQQTMSDVVLIDRVAGTVYNVNRHEGRANYRLIFNAVTTTKGTCEKSAAPAPKPKGAPKPKF